MQYVLTEKEYHALTEAGVKAELRLNETLQDLCTKVADHMPAGVAWLGKAEPWGCILTKRAIGTVITARFGMSAHTRTSTGVNRD